MKTLKAYTWHYHTSCPTTKMALIGYSSGAVIVMNDLCYGGNGEGTPQINPKLAGHVSTSNSPPNPSSNTARSLSD